MYQDFKELLSILNDSKVRYLVVGGYAVSFHAQPRATMDLDILIKPDAGNAAAVYTALGIRSGGGELRFDDAAPAADVRRAIMAGKTRK